MNHQENLFSEFETVSANQWLEKVIKDLKGKPIEGLNRTIEGMELTPFYHQDNQDTTLGPIAQYRDNNDWCLVEEILVSNANTGEVNKTVLESLANGTEGYRFFIKENISKEALVLLFRDIELAYIQTHFAFDASVDADSFLNNFKSVLANKKGEKDDYRGSVQVLGQRLDLSVQSDFPCFSFMVVENYEVSAIAQLTNLLKKTITRFSESETTDDMGRLLADSMSYKLTIGKDYFLEIAKLRALRVLHANVLSAFKLDTTTVPQIQVGFNPSVYDEVDPNQNLIGITTMTMAAAIGGANVITVLPADKGTSENSRLYQRMARNVQHMLKLESFLDRVVDPSAGSYYVEHLTSELCKKVWTNIQGA